MSVVLVTGAATGIGGLVARALAHAGHTGYPSVRDVDGGNAAHAAELRANALESGADLHVVGLDVTAQDSADAAVRSVEERHGRLDALINNAVGAHRGNRVVGKATMDALAVTTAYQANAFGIGTVIVIPGAITEGTGT
ncbi:SDR family NAD(P)-dependent oxidoreductase [Plantactinospora sp. WMMB782]|uniref:SDR family NAD(P)-dependent oxidoreductase n=1 Tax=Plantactinospora sp. WMMB782 TaxID=3404121 RepID=UPI003B961F29